MTEGLEEMGIAGGTFLQEALTNTTDPLGAIEEFQVENSILLPSLQSALPLLDLHGIRRREFHTSTFEELRNKLIERISDISKSGDASAVEKLEAILDKSFPLIKIESLQPVSMCLFSHLPEVPEHYLSEIIKDKQLYSRCPVEVKRQIWQNNQAMFGDEVLPLLTQYIKDKDSIIFENEISSTNTFFSASPKSRRQGPVVQKLTEMIGKNVRLYDMVLQFLRTLFIKTENVHYCSLRAEILMALHDLEINEVCSVDPCYKFTWCLDACVREKFVDVKRARELQGFLDSIRKGHEQVLGDLSMILCDPFAVNTMLLSIMQALQNVLTHESLPRDSAELVLLIRMLALGQAAWDIINNQVFKEPRIDLDIVTKFVPSLSVVAMCDIISSFHTKMNCLEKSLAENHEESGSSEDRETDKANYKLDESDNNSIDILQKFVQSEPLSCLIMKWYILSLIQHNKKSLLIKLLPLLGKQVKDTSGDMIFVNTLISHLVLLPSQTTTSQKVEDLLADDAFCVVFFKFLLQGKLTKESIHRHALRLLVEVCPRLPSPRLKTLMLRLEPKGKKATEILSDLYLKLQDKVSSIATNVDAKNGPNDHDLLGVPTPSKPF